MIRFDNDYSRSAHPKIIEALSEDMYNSYAGYGLDSWCEIASDEIRKAIGKPDADIHYLIGGTQTNMTVHCNLTDFMCQSASDDRMI